MASPKASISKPSKKPKFTIIPPKQLFIDLTNEDTITPSPKLHESSPSAPNAPSKTPSTKDTSSSSIDYTLLTKKKDFNLIIVQIYVNDIIFGSTCQEMCDDFAKIMHDEFEMSMMGELNFFLGLQIKQLDDEIFFNQSKYIKEMLKKFGLEDSKPMKTPMSTETKLTRDEDGESVDNTKYRGMIEDPKTSHLEAVKRIF
ncbi:retrovirus-related pol polyprotein from transposon TNT 1-94 [Tanacetum coccineum]